MFVRLGRPWCRSLERPAVPAGESGLLVGAWSGADLPLMPGVRAVATDPTPAQLARARGDVRFAVTDAVNLGLPAATFDAAVLHLILAHVPDLARCLARTARVERPAGPVSVLDKFLPEGASAGLVHRCVNAGARLLATDINRRLGGIVRESGVRLRIVHGEAVACAELVRVVLLRHEP